MSRAPYYVCLKTGDNGRTANRFTAKTPMRWAGSLSALISPTSRVEPALEDDQGICGNALGAFDSKASSRAMS